MSGDVLDQAYFIMGLPVRVRLQIEHNSKGVKGNPAEVRGRTKKLRDPQNAVFPTYLFEL